ncbi:ABC transporter ATP-binding protein [Methanococcoides sp. SA1]|nr:ABC transporter ATP-binding protein [Methanococcoides sp. SA1]
MDAILSLNNVSKKFGNMPVLKGIDLDINKGEFVALLGANGAGKTTLVKIMSALSSPSEGTVMVNGKDISKDQGPLRAIIGVISHETYLYNDLTAVENLRFFGQMYGIASKKLEARINGLLEQVELVKRADDRVSTFSRGMKQRLSIARALLHEPSILFLDEPYTGLDQHAAHTFEKVLLDLDPKDTTRLMISHEISRTYNMCDRVIILDKGCIVFDSLMSEVASAEDLRGIYLAHVGDNDTF